MDLIEYEPSAIDGRKISLETARKFLYGRGHAHGEPVHVATYCDLAGRPVAQKLRWPGKRFAWTGDPKAVGFYGQHLYRPGKRVVVTEGEIDALSYAEAVARKWPVVSVPNGAQGAAKTVTEQAEWLEQFEEVIFLFDQDEPGQAAAAECAELLTPGKAKIGWLPRKDASDTLLELGPGELAKAPWNARPYRPDGILDGRDLWEQVNAPMAVSDAEYPWPLMNHQTHGLRKSELVIFCAGSGIGKSTACREVAYHLLSQGESVGYVALEETVQRTCQGIISLAVNRPLHLNPAAVDEDARRKAFDETVGSGRFFVYDHWGSIETKNLVSKIRAMARGDGVGWVILDHISIVVSGLETQNERKDLDVAMTGLRALAQEAGVGIIVVSHLKRVGDRPFEKGAQVQLSDLRGSSALEGLSDMVIAFERDQQDEKLGNQLTVRVLKNRFSGETGKAGHLKYDRETGRLEEANPFED